MRPAPRIEKRAGIRSDALEPGHVDRLVTRRPQQPRVEQSLEFLGRCDQFAQHPLGIGIGSRQTGLLQQQRRQDFRACAEQTVHAGTQIIEPVRRRLRQPAQFLTDRVAEIGKTLALFAHVDQADARLCQVGLQAGQRTAQQRQRLEPAFFREQNQTDGFADPADLDALLGVLQRLSRVAQPVVPILPLAAQRVEATHAVAEATDQRQVCVCRVVERAELRDRLVVLARDARLQLGNRRSGPVEDQTFQDRFALLEFAHGALAVAQLRTKQAHA